MSKKKLNFFFWTGSCCGRRPEADDERSLCSNRKAFKGSVFTMKTLVFSFVLPLEDCETEISITGGISGDSLRQRNEFIFYISEYVLYRI